MLILLLLPLLVLLLGAFLLAWWSHRDQPEAGLVAGRLRADGSGSNFVCSDADTRPDRAVAPFAFTDTPEAAWVRLRILVIESGGEVKRETSDYLWATFTTPVMRFVDDVELRLDRAANVIQIRSASRVGNHDLGVNRRRVETLRERWTATTPE
jgi:uncharacterized protein (DUF1499 family)